MLEFAKRLLDVVFCLHSPYVSLLLPPLRLLLHGNDVILIIISLGLPDYLSQVRVTRTIELKTFRYTIHRVEDTYAHNSLAR